MCIEKFQQIDPTDIRDNAFSMIGDEWMLVTAGTPDSFNTMTASWGGVGVLWGQKAATIYIRPQRYTFEFLEKNDYFTLSFFGNAHRDALALCGSKSGRDIDKAQATGLTPAAVDHTVCFEEARLVYVCKKLYYQDFEPANFLDSTIEKNYPQQDYHRMYIGGIEKVLSR